MILCALAQIFRLERFGGSARRERTARRSVTRRDRQRRSCTRDRGDSRAPTSRVASTRDRRKPIVVRISCVAPFAGVHDGARARGMSRRGTRERCANRSGDHGGRGGSDRCPRPSEPTARRVTCDTPPDAGGMRRSRSSERESGCLFGSCVVVSCHRRTRATDDGVLLDRWIKLRSSERAAARGVPDGRCVIRLRPPRSLRRAADRAEGSRDGPGGTRDHRSAAQVFIGAGQAKPGASPPAAGDVRGLH